MKAGLFLALLACVEARAPSFLFLLADDIGWADFSYNNGTAMTPNIDAWARRSGSVLFQDFHSGGTVCSPTRATVLTGRNHFRDCVNYVDSCSDMSECVSHFEFAPQKTYTIGDAARAAGLSYDSQFFGKWHLGSFYNDSEKYQGLTSSPVTHGFGHFNATVEVAPTSTANCMCKDEWKESCNFGHYGKPTHCAPTNTDCCFNYWWDDDTKEHAVTNLTWQSPDDDTLYLTDSFDRFLAKQKAANAPFLGQISFHNCHMPYIGTEAHKADCVAGKTCKAPAEGAAPYDAFELDFYACLVELDGAVGRVISTLEKHGYYDETMMWFTTDNGPEQNCQPEGFCDGTEHRPVVSPVEGPGSAGPLRGRKRDTWEGGHRVPGIVSYPNVVKGNHESWEMVVTMDFLPTVMDILKVERPKDQQDWAMDGKSIAPLFNGGKWPVEREMGWAFMDPDYSSKDNKGIAYRKGTWKMVAGSQASCAKASCAKPQLYDLSVDLGEKNDVSAQNPTILKDLMAKYAEWQASVEKSIKEESKCQGVDELFFKDGRQIAPQDIDK